MGMLDWAALEERFRKLVTPHQSIWIDHQTGATGSIWHLACSGDMQARAEFCELSTIAGRKLGELPQEILPEGVRLERDAMHRWFAMIEANTASMDRGMYGELTNPEGESIGYISSHRIDSPARDSARVCLRLASIPRPDTDVSVIRKVWRVVSENPLVSGIIAAIIGGVVLAILL